MDQHSILAGLEPAIVTGKPVALGGSLGRASATGLGVLYATQCAAARADRGIAGLRLAIQGYGNVGSWVARGAAAAGAVVVAVQDASGAVGHERGLDIDELDRHLAQGGLLADFPGGDPLSADELVATACDVFVPAALGGMLDRDAAQRLQAWLVVEGANGPTTTDAEEALVDRGVVVVPDVMANAGGVIVSYFEWVQNMQQVSWSAADVDQRLRRRMTTLYDEVAARRKADGSATLREAAYDVALSRVLDATRLRGIN
jgi:glutamate dehydrogenase (NAD(P)+)